MMQGNQARARQAAANYRKMNDDPSNAIAVLVRFRKWDELLSFPDPGEESKTDVHDVHALRGFWHFARGLAFAAQRRIDQSQAELDALRAETALAPAAAGFDGPPDVQHVLDKITHSVDAYDLKIGAAILGSRIAEAQRRMPQAIGLMRAAVKLQDEMPYSEPPPWFYPVGESLGALLLRRASPAESEAVFRETLQHSPNDPRALLGLSAAMQAEGRKTEAAAQKALFQAAWRFSDVTVSVEDL